MKDADAPRTAKSERCEQACIDALRAIHPRMVGHRKLAIMLADPYRDLAGSGDVSRSTPRGATLAETYCDELVRRALNNLVAAGKLEKKQTRGRGLTMLVFGCKAEE